MMKSTESKLYGAVTEKVKTVNMWPRIEAQLHLEDSRRRMPLQRVLIGGAAILLALLLAATPPGRAVAQEIIERIGQVKFILNQTTVANSTRDSLNEHEASDTGPQAGIETGQRKAPDDQSPASSATEIPEAVPWTPPDASLAEAAEVLGGAVLQAGYLPECFNFAWRDAGTSAVGARYVYTLYSCKTKGGELRAALMLRQSVYPEGASDSIGRWYVGDAHIEDTVVRGLPGKFVAGADIAIVEQDILAWEEAGFDFSMVVESGFLSLKELLAVAEGLR